MGRLDKDIRKAWPYGLGNGPHGLGNGPHRLGNVSCSIPGNIENIFHNLGSTLRYFFSGHIHELFK